MVSRQPATSRSCKTTGTGLVHCVVCPFTPQRLLVLIKRPQSLHTELAVNGKKGNGNYGNGKKGNGKKGSRKKATVITATGKNGNRKKSTSVKTATKFDSSHTTCTDCTSSDILCYSGHCGLYIAWKFFELFPNITYGSSLSLRIASIYFR